MSKGFEIVDGVYVGPEVYSGSLDLEGTDIKSLGDLREVDSFLDLRHTGVTDLGDLRKVSRSLWLKGTGVTSLGGLSKVGGQLDLRHTDVTDLGDIREVGTFVYTGTGYLYKLPKLEKLVKEIENYSLNELVERLPGEEDPFLKRVIEKVIRE